MDRVLSWLAVADDHPQQAEGVPGHAARQPGLPLLLHPAPCSGHLRGEI